MLPFYHNPFILCRHYLEYPIPEKYQKEPTEPEVEFWRSKLQDRRGKFGRTFLVNPPEPLYPHDSSEQRINAFSGRWEKVS